MDILFLFNAALQIDRRLNNTKVIEAPVFDDAAALRQWLDTAPAKRCNNICRLAIILNSVLCEQKGYTMTINALKLVEKARKEQCALQAALSV